MNRLTRNLLWQGLREKTGGNNIHRTAESFLQGSCDSGQVEKAVSRRIEVHDEVDIAARADPTPRHGTEHTEFRHAVAGGTIEKLSSAGSQMLKTRRLSREKQLLLV